MKKQNTTKKPLLNNVTFLLDGSGSISQRGLVRPIVNLANEKIKELAELAKKTKQRTRVSVFAFSGLNQFKPIFQDVDVADAPIVTDSFYFGNGTALIQSTSKILDSAEKVDQTVYDTSCLIYVLTDGEDTEGGDKNLLARRIKALSTYTTVGILVPDETSRQRALNCGFADGNITVWDVNSGEKGVKEVSRVMTVSTSSYYANRSKGIRSTTTLFTPNVNFTKTDVVKNLDPLKPTEYLLISVHQKKRIDEFVKSWTKDEYVVGSGYYQLTKPEIIQGYKQVVLREKATGKLFSGPQTRELLGLPTFEVKIAPATHPKYDIFIQSSAPNRNLVPGTQLVVLK